MKGQCMNLCSQCPAWHAFGCCPAIMCDFHCFLFPDVPKDQQLQAVQAAILLLPKENREALKILLFFLRDVVACVEENQMTPTNIAVCLAPSLFHLNTLRRDSSSSSTRYFILLSIAACSSIFLC